VGELALRASVLFVGEISQFSLPGHIRPVEKFATEPTFSPKEFEKFAPEEP
jgi:hypothetical protein